MDEIELSLGLSLNGQFGVDPNSKTNDKSLQRSSSSAPNFMDFSRALHVTPLERTSWLPVEPEQEMRKRKQVQMLRRIEAKKKLGVKQRVSCIKSDDEDRISDVVRVGYSGLGFEDDEYEFHGHSPTPGTRSTETKSPQSVFSFAEQNEYHSTFNSAVTKKSDTTHSETSLSVNTGMKQSQINSRSQEMVQNFANMPCVSTKANGPNGKRVEGFLYGYRKGEVVRIICACHGSSLSPAEFIKHAGGGDIEHPLRHIVVNPAPCSSIAITREWMETSKTS